VRPESVRTGSLVGIADAPVRAVESGDLAALVSTLPDSGLRLRRRDLHRHLAVLEHAFRSGTLLACRFGTVVESEDAVRRDVLDARREDLLAALRRLAGASQLNVRIAYDEDGIVAQIVAAQPAIAALSGEARRLGDAGHFARIRVGELVAHALAERRERDRVRLLDRLVRVAEDVVTEPADELTALKASFLVLDPERFDRELEALATEERAVMRVESIGPLPPTAFVAAGEV
jgi:hypothetical protein